MAGVLRRGHQARPRAVAPTIRIPPTAWPLALFAVLSLGVVAWFRAGNPIGYGDAGILESYYNPGYLFSLYRFAWNPAMGAGQPNGQALATLPIVATFSLLAALHVPPFLRQALFYAFIQFSSLTCMYLFLLLLFRKRHERMVIAITGALLYCYNPMTMVEYWYGGFMIQPILAFPPAMLLLCEISRALSLPIFALLSAATVGVFSIVFLNPAFALPVLILIGAFWLFRTIQTAHTTSELRRSLMAISVVGCSTILANSWFILPFIGSFRYNYGVASAAENPLETLKAASTFSTVDSLMRFLIYRSHAGVWGYMNPTWRFTYDGLVFVLISLIIAVVMFRTLLSRRLNGVLLFFSVLWVVGVFLCLGTNQPLGSLFLFMFSHIPYFQAFRSPASKFLPVLLVSAVLLVSSGLADIYRYIMDKAGTAVAVLCLGVVMIATCGVYAYPMWTGSVVNSPISNYGSPVTPDFRVPTSYDVVARLLAGDNSIFSVLSLPLRPDVYARLRWERGYDGGDPAWLLYQRPTLANLNYPPNDAAHLLQAVSQDGIEQLIEGGAVLGAKYVAVQGDIDVQHGNYDGRILTDPSTIERELDNLRLRTALSAGRLRVYEVPGRMVVPTVYATSYEKVATVVDQSEVPALLFDAEGYFNSRAVVVADQNPAATTTLAHRSNGLALPRRIQYEQINPTRWDVTVDGAGGPFLLVLGTGFDPEWRAFILPASPRQDGGRSGSELAGEHKPGFALTPQDLRLLHVAHVSDSSHIEVNGYANGWLIVPPDAGGSFRVVLYYMPQSWFYIGLCCSIVTVLFLCIICILAIQRGRSRGKRWYFGRSSC